MEKRILIIDDEKDICLLLERFLAKKGYDCKAVSDENEGFDLIKQNAYDLVITDLRLPSISGIELLQKIKILSPATKVIIITGYSDIKTAVEAIKYGASDYVSKPLYPDELLNTIKTALEQEETPSNTVEKKINKAQVMQSNYVVGDSNSSKKLFDDINLVAPTDMSVLIMGQTGTGKEYVAREIHKRSDRKDKNFTAIDCGALPKDIAASEFFGHEKGAFTGALRDKEGIFNVANGGTLFLDEIGNLSYEIQVQLLRVLQEKTYKKVGGNKEYTTDVRIVAATNDHLNNSIEKGDFRQDLFYRINEFQMHVAPVSHRPDDIAMFAEHFLQRSNASLNKSVQGFDPEVIEIFKAYSWPGNLREMKNVIKRATLSTTGTLIHKNSLPEQIVYAQNTEHKADDNQGDLKNAANKAEKETILKVLAETGNNKTKAAQILNIDRKTLYNKLKNF